MPTFEYQAQDNDGQQVSGVVFGQSLDQALQELAGRGVQVTKIGIAVAPGDPVPQEFVSPAASEGSSAEQPTYSGSESASRTEDLTAQRSYMETSVVGPLVGTVGLDHLAFFFHQFGTMLHAGVPIVQTLDTLAGQSRSPKLAQVIREMKEHAGAGRPISSGMQRYPEVFSPVILSLVRAGEEGGFIDGALALVARYLDQEIQLRNLYRRVTFYPKLQIAASIVIILATNLIIASLGKEGGLASPLTTLSTWIWLGPLIVAAFLFYRVGLANPRMKYNWDTIGSNLPYLGTTLRQLAMARFGRAFGALYKGGVPVNRALTLAADACGNEYLRARMYPATRALEGGAGISETLRDTAAFSPVVLDMIQTGETTGNLDQMLGKMSDYYEDEASTRATQMGHVVGVVLALLVAVYIGYIVISFWIGHYSGIGTES